MGKRSKKTKAKTADFQKVKLKVGKKRPLPNNVTEVAFKSQSIYIPEQMRNVKINEDAKTDFISDQQRNVPELLGQVGHFNSNFRTDALTSLRVHLSNNKHLIQHFLPKIIEKTSKTMVDEDQQVRRSCIAFFRLVFSNIAEFEMSPFFDVVLSHLYCAMSHIFDDVQRDSLQIVDLLIENFSGLLTEVNRNSLLLHFIEMISTKRTSSAASNKAAKVATGTARVLSMKLSSKETSISWRNRILDRLHKLLKISDDVKTTKSCDFDPKLLENLSVKYDATNGVQISWDSRNIGKILTNFGSKNLTNTGFLLRTNPMSNLSSFSSEKNSTRSPWQQITTIFPLLFDCWHEATSDETRNPRAETVTTMNLVLNIINILCERTINFSDEKLDAILKIRSTYMEEFRQYFYSSFPINHHTSARQRNARKRKAEEIGSTDIQTINLSICELVTSLSSEKYLKDDAEILSVVATFLSMLLVSKDGSREPALGSRALEQVIASTRSLLGIAADEGTRENLLRPMLIYYQSINKGNSEDKTKILEFFFELYTNEGRSLISNNPVIVEWICLLPDLLMEAISKKVKTAKKTEPSCQNIGSDHVHVLLSCMRLACVRGSLEFSETMETKKTEILSILNNSVEEIFCDPGEEKMNSESGKPCSECAKLQASIFEIFIHHSPCLTEEIVTLLSKISHKVQIPAENVCYICGLLTSHSKKNSSSNEFLLMMKFMFSVLIGISKEDLVSLQLPLPALTQQSCTIRIVGTDCDTAIEFERHVAIVDKLCELLPSIDYVSQLLQHFICDKIMKQYNTFPIRSVYSILKVSQMVLKSDETQRKDLVNVVGKLCTGILLHIYGKLNSDINIHVYKILAELINGALLDIDVMKKTVKCLGETDFNISELCQSTCNVLEKLAINVDLHEVLLQSKEDLSEIMEKMEASSPDVCEADWYKSTSSNLSVLIH